MNVIGICMDLAYKYELKLKGKMHQRKKSIHNSNWTLKSKQETNESRKVLQRFVDILGITWLETKHIDPENKMT